MVWLSVELREEGKDKLLLWKRRSGRVDKVSEEAKDETEALDCLDFNRGELCWRESARHKPCERANERRELGWEMYETRLVLGGKRDTAGIACSFVYFLQLQASNI